MWASINNCELCLSQVPHFNLIRQINIQIFKAGGKRRPCVWVAIATNASGLSLFSICTCCSPRPHILPLCRDHTIPCNAALISRLYTPNAPQVSCYLAHSLHISHLVLRILFKGSISSFKLYFFVSFFSDLCGGCCMFQPIRCLYVHC